MTAIFGWQDGPDVFLIGDSVVTGSGSPRSSISSFGEATIKDRVTIEEAAIKIVELPRSVIAGVSGNVSLAVSYLEILAKDLRETAKPVRQIMVEVGPIFLREREEFEILVAHAHESGVALARARTTEPLVSPVESGVAVLGSLPGGKQVAAAEVISQIRKHRLPPEARLAAAIVHLQAGGILDYLLVHGVGGTLFGARLNSAGVHWQPDLMYFLYGRGVFGSAPIMQDSDEPLERPKDSNIGLVRVLVRHGGGIVLSSLGNPRGRLFVPPGRRLSDAEWQEIVVAAVPPPFELLAPSQYYGFLSTAFRKATFFGQLEHTREASGVGVTGRVGRREIRIVPRLVNSLEEGVPQGHFDFSIVTENAQGIEATGYRLHEAGL